MRKVLTQKSLILKNILIILLTLSLFNCQKKDDLVDPDVEELITSRQWRSEDHALFVTFKKDNKGYYSNGDSFEWQYDATDKLIKLRILRATAQDLEKEHYRILHISPDCLSVNIEGIDDLYASENKVKFYSVN